MKTLNSFKEQRMQDADFAKEYEAMQPGLDVIRAIG